MLPTTTAAAAEATPTNNINKIKSVGINEEKINI